MLKAVVPAVFLVGLTPLYATGNLAWKHATTVDARGLLRTAGGLLFGTDGTGNFIAFDANTGNPRWHPCIGSTTNSPETHMLHGHQYVIVGAADSLYAFYIQ